MMIPDSSHSLYFEVQRYLLPPVRKIGLNPNGLLVLYQDMLDMSRDFWVIASQITKYPQSYQTSSTKQVSTTGAEMKADLSK